jgi:lipopolysaccharide/colanic/teichoic acid biosynthesis glycosyltransferase
MLAFHAVSRSRQVLERTSRRSPLGESVYRGLNQLAAGVILLALAPLLVILALLIWRCDGAPVLFGHYRVGLNGRLFRCLKFRSMYLDSQHMLADLLQRDSAARARWQRDHKLADDPRITPVGRVLRRTSLDELPQLLNVLRGEMLLVGPRPITVAELTRYGRVRWHYLSVPPGMTGLWQVTGRNNTTYDERVALDHQYVEHRSWHLDLSILIRTIKVVLTRDGAI